MSRPKRGRRARRRRPGHNWEVWSVPHPAGYLVTSRASCPKPVAFVPRRGSGVLATAFAIRDDHAAAGAGGRTVDLRGRAWDRLPRWLEMKLLFPVDSLGRVIRGDGEFAAGMYVRDPLRVTPGAPASGGLSFMMLTHSGLSMYAKSGSPATPRDPQPPSNGIGSAHAPTAA